MAERRDRMPYPDEGWQEDGHRLVFRMMPTPDHSPLAGPYAAVAVDCPVEGGCLRFRRADGSEGAMCALADELSNSGSECVTGFDGDLALPAVLRWKTESYTDWTEPLTIEPALSPLQNPGSDA